MFDKVLVANRGEIAVRIIKTLKSIGVTSYAIYSDADAEAMHKSLADVALPIGGHAAADSYLKIDTIIQLSVAHGIQAIHPGYGFLSENVEFAEACVAAGIVFIGPKPEHIRDFGLKHCARELAKAVGVPVTSGTGLLTSSTDALDKADSIGYPIMLKNTAGGGGIGIQVCHGRDEVTAAFDAVQRIGEVQFHGAGIFLEQYISSGRHIEVQIFGDGNGKVAIVGDRDCSLQRRNQKFIEECPAPNLPDETRKGMYECARRLCESVSYRSAGTVEFIFDYKKNQFYFLEVNTRIQVEHTVTEEVCRLDLIACMMHTASNELYDISFMNRNMIGSAIEVRINAEDPLHSFKPCPGILKEVVFPFTMEGVRIDTGVETNSEVPMFYDSLIAKIIVKADTRSLAIERMLIALENTIVLGIVTNIDLAKCILSSELFKEASIHTKFLDSFQYKPRIIEVIEGGSYSTVQDYPGRTKYWAVGVPPSGPMDDYSFRLANRLVNNDSSKAGIECTVSGPTLLFHEDAIISVTGGVVSPSINKIQIPMYSSVVVKAGQILSIGKVLRGVRCYIAISGGINTPMYLGSKSTFVLGKFGSVHGDGALLKAGDLIPFASSNEPVPNFQLSSALVESFSFPSQVSIGVLYGPHGAPDFFSIDSIAELLSTEYEVHYNSSRLGVRLIGPKPKWARESGGEAGLHPSNIHDCEYAIGSINFTGDSPVILTCDGPSLGGFVCPVVIAKAELWKVGQLKPGDLVRFICINHKTAVALNEGIEKSIDSMDVSANAQALINDAIKPVSCVLHELPASGSRPAVIYRQAGDSNILLEYGDMELNLSLRVRIYSLMKTIEEKGIYGIIELSPGVRSLQIQYNHAQLDPEILIQELVLIESSLPNSLLVDVPSRVIRMPMAFEDSDTLLAVERYRQTVRASAPWLPNNVDFIQRMNGLAAREDVSKAVFEAAYLVLGLGDVYLGAPCAVPLDPRHRLITSKYNPARTFTAEGTVGIGGVYMCIYGMDSPGGYQLVGKTLPIWTRGSSIKEPWLLKNFDQVSFYQVTEEELSKMRKAKDFSAYIKVYDSVFNVGTYEAGLRLHDATIKNFHALQKSAFDEEVKLWATDEISEESNVPLPTNAEDLPEGCVTVLSTSYGCVWKILREVGSIVEKDETLIILEAMKMETTINSPIKGTISSIVCTGGKMVKTGDLLMLIEAATVTDLHTPDQIDVGIAGSTNEWIYKPSTPIFVEEAQENGSLKGILFAVKDNIDVHGCPTTAACPQFSYRPTSNATVVDKLLKSGAHMVGKTNLDQFACGLNGTRSPFGIVPNSFDPEYICGGSSSGSCFAVATGQVDFSLGTDTAGSGRVPAGLNNIVGLKPSKGLFSNKGVIPAAASADCVSIFSRTVDMAWKALMEAKGFDPSDPFSRALELNMTSLGSNFVFGVPDDLNFFGDELSNQSFASAVKALEEMGGKQVVIEYGPLAQIATMLYEDAFVAERYSGIRSFFDTNEIDVIEPVRSIVAKGKSYAAADLYDAQLKLRTTVNLLKPMWESIDFIVVPTSPTHYRIKDMLADPVNLNRNLGTYTNFVNLLDYAAISIPSSIREDGLPFGITLIAPFGSDFQLAELGQRFHHSRCLDEGALHTPLPEPSFLLSTLSKSSSLHLAVVGAHLMGMPLHHQLTNRGAKFIKKCKTSSSYKLYAIANSVPPKPALVYVGNDNGNSIEIEIYELNFESVGSFLVEIPTPLGLGTLQIEDGTYVKGFIAEPRATDDALDISDYGSWRAYVASRK